MERLCTEKEKIQNLEKIYERRNIKIYTMDYGWLC